MTSVKLVRTANGGITVTSADAPSSGGGGGGGISGGAIAGIAVGAVALLLIAGKTQHRLTAWLSR